MGYGIYGFGFHLSMCNTDFVCPICECPHTEGDFEKVRKKSKKLGMRFREGGFVPNDAIKVRSEEEYIKCKGCKRKLGFTFDLDGNLQVWEI